MPTQPLAPGVHALVLVLMLIPSWAQAEERSLTDALLELRTAGLKLVFTSNAVRPEMVVATEPTSDDPRQTLDQLLKPHGLEIRDGPAGTLIVVPGPNWVGHPRAEDRRTALAGIVRSARDATLIAEVTVVLASDSLPAAGIEVSTDAEGAFRLPGPGHETITEGSYTLEVRRRGFVVERFEDVTLRTGRTTWLTIYLNPSPVTEEKLIVTPSQLALLREQPTATLGFSRDDLGALPHLGEDFFRALTLLPGVLANDVSAAFHVRGARRNETQVLLDGQELYEAYHLKDYDDALSLVAPGTLDRVDFSTGGFSAEHGDRMAGVLDMRTVTPSGPRRSWLGISVLSAHAGTAGTFDDQRGAYLVQGRRGAIDLAAKLIGDEDPQYWDAFGKLDYQLSLRQSLRLHLLHADDRLRFAEADSESSKRTETDYTNSYAWLTHQALLSDTLFVDTAVSLSRVQRDRGGLELDEDVGFVVRDERDLDVLGVRQDWHWQANPSQRSTRHYLKWGLGYRQFDSRYDYRAAYTFDSPLADVRDDPDAEETTFRAGFREDHASAYAADQLRLGDRLTVELGLRYDRHSQTRESHASPRLNFAWAHGDRSVLRAAWGRYLQSQRPYELAVADGDTTFYPVERSEHRVLGFEHRFGPSTLHGSRWRGLALRIEAYQRRVRNPLPRYENLYEPINTFPEVEPDRVRVEPDGAIAEGVELFLRGRLGARTGWWINYAYAETDDEIDGQRVPRRFDQTHSLNVDVDIQLSDHWTLNAAWRYHTGWPTTPLSLMAVVLPDEDEDEDDDGDADGSLGFGSQAGAGKGETVFVPVLGAPFSDRLDAYHRLDLRASRRWTLASGNVLVFFVDVQNAYDRKNLSGFDYEIDEEQGVLTPTEEEWAGILPSMGIRYEF